MQFYTKNCTSSFTHCTVYPSFLLQHFDTEFCKGRRHVVTLPHTAHRKDYEDEKSILVRRGNKRFVGTAVRDGALVYDENGTEIARFVGRCPIEGDTDKWVVENVLPQMEEVKESHDSYDALLGAFAEFYLANKGKDGDTDVIVHMGTPVEAKVLIELRAGGHIGDWDGPFPLKDLVGYLETADEDPTSVDSYVQKHDLSVGEFEGGTHNPLYDSAAAAVAYRHLRSK